jgi:hypothetical protein
LTDVGRDGLPSLAGRFGECRQGFHGWARYLELLFDKKLACRLAGAVENESRHGHPCNFRRAALQTPRIGRHP